jgi:hypothetical protein
MAAIGAAGMQGAENPVKKLLAADPLAQFSGIMAAFRRINCWRERAGRMIAPGRGFASFAVPALTALEQP